jgi:hypothetical protein
MRRKVLGIWLVAMLFSIASLMAVASDPEPNAFYSESSGDIGPEAIKFIDPFQNTSKTVEVFKPPPEKIFQSGKDPLWMNVFLNISVPDEVTVYYMLINLKTKKVKFSKGTWPINTAGNWRLSLGWRTAPPELAGLQLLIAFAKGKDGKVVKCPQPWWFFVKP